MPLKAAHYGLLVQLLAQFGWGGDEQRLERDHRCGAGLTPVDDDPLLQSGQG
jgi:hypothetical protein